MRAGSQVPDEISAVAELFVSNGEQTVRLPKEFRIEADYVKLRRFGTGLLLEPQGSPAGHTEEQVDMWLRKLEQHNTKHGDFMSDGRNQPAMPSRSASELFD